MPLNMENEPTSGTGGVVVTFQNMYNQLQQLVGELRDVNSNLRNNDLRASDFETRLRGLERWRYALPSSLVIAVGSAATAIVTAIVK